ncbi:MAG TPA: glycosyltransferase [Rhizomicrobium sp.]
MTKSVFQDRTGRRAVRVTWIGWTIAALTIVLGLVFTVTLFAPSHMEAARLPGHISALKVQRLEKEAAAPGLMRSAIQLAGEARAKRLKLLLKKLAVRERAAHVLASAKVKHAGRPLSIAFYPNWQAAAYDSLRVALPTLDWVVPTWLSLQGPDLKLKDAYNKKIEQLIRSRPKVAILPVIQNSTLGRWDGPGMAALLADANRRTGLVRDLSAYIGGRRLQGIVVDFESLPDSAMPNLGLFLKSVRHAFAPHGWTVAVAAPFANDKWPFAEFAADVDYTMLMAYDEHASPHAPGSVAGQTWFENTLDKRMEVLSPDRTIVALGSYAYDWNEDDVDNLSFEEAVIAANDSDATVQFDPQTNNPHFSYVEDDHTRHDVWLLDGVTAYNEIHAADLYRPAGYAVWRLGSEDPSIWSVMGRPYGETAPADLRSIPTIEDIDFEGSGELLRVEAQPQSGARTFETERATGDIDDEIYTKLPTGYVIRQFGAARKELALTFDDGPDPEWTPEILNILHAEHVPATFFVIGSNAEAYPELVQQMVDEGHEVGNHTFTHPNLSETPDSVTALELNATQRLFQALTGRSMRLFRPPYLGDAEPTDNDEIEPVQVAQEMGYIAVGEHVDPVDWELPGVDTIVSRALQMVHEARPNSPRNIILFHDAGGDRSQTIAALPILIEKLKAQGYRFVPVSGLIGFTRDQAMPPLPPTVSLLTDRVVFYALSKIGRVLHWAFLLAIWLGIGRVLFLVVLALRNFQNEQRQAKPPAALAADMRVSVVIPAYNEERVIVRSVRRILESTHQALEVIVVDDGSQDETAGVVVAQFGGDPRVTLLRSPNGGKANALNIALAHATGDVVVALDADTIFKRDAVARLVRWFVDPAIGAVAGNAKVGNRINMITRWQALEYVGAQNLERRALAALGTLTVVPGAIGAWRRSAVEGLGGFPVDTVAEDQDLTIGLQRAGFRVLFDSSAIAWTEAPTTFRALARQRFRWAYGTLQCLWKHRRVTFSGSHRALGLIALPQVWLFQIVLTALAPVADLMLLWQLIWQGTAYLEHGAEFNNDSLIQVGLYYGLFVILDMAAAGFGYLIEGSEQKRLLWSLPLQRFGYRQLMYYVVVRSIFTALKGAVVGWGKQERTATVAAFEPQEAA